MTQIIQTLKICLRGGQVVEIPFHAEKSNELNPQIKDFIKAYGDENKKDGKFLFQGQRGHREPRHEVQGSRRFKGRRKEGIGQEEGLRALLRERHLNRSLPVGSVMSSSMSADFLPSIVI